MILICKQLLVPVARRQKQSAASSIPEKELRPLCIPLSASNKPEQATGTPEACRKLENTITNNTSLDLIESHVSFSKAETCTTGNQPGIRTLCSGSLGSQSVTADPRSEP